MSWQHKKMVSLMAGYLKSIGASDIMTEVQLVNTSDLYSSSVVVDLTAKGPDGEHIAAECGFFQTSGFKERLALIAAKYDSVYWLPTSSLLFLLIKKDFSDIIGVQTIYSCVCSKCGHRWEPRKSIPRMCPKCKRYDWLDLARLKEDLVRQREVGDEVNTPGKDKPGHHQ